MKNRSIMSQKKPRVTKGPSRRPISVTHYCWWVWGDNEKGRRVALGGYETEAAAHEARLSRYPDPSGVVVKLLPTRNLAAAKRMLKAHDIEQGKMIDEAMRNSSNSKTLREPYE